MNLIWQKYKLIAIGVAFLAAAIGLLWTGHHYGAQGVQAKWDRDTTERKQAENAAILTRIKNNERQVEQDKINSQRIAKEHKDEMDKVRADIIADRVRVGPKFCSGSAEGTKADSTSSGDGANTGSRLLPPEIERDIKSLKEEMERAAAAGRACQKFVRSNGMAPD